MHKYNDIRFTYVQMSPAVAESHSHYIGIIVLLWLYSPLLGLGCFFSFLILYTVSRTPWTGDQPIARPLPTYRTTQRHTKHTQYRYPCLELDSNPPIPAFKRAKTVNALDQCFSTAWPWPKTRPWHQLYRVLVL
jgi:hypothetical protein